MNSTTKVRQDAMHLDANESVFFKRELEYIKARTYDTKYKQLKAFGLIPISSEANNGATEITWRKYSMVGFAKIIADYAIDFPRVDVYGEETTVKVKDIGDSYGYSIQEIRRSQMAGKRLDQRRSDTARRAIEEKINAIALLGDSLSGLNGIIKYPGITEYTVPADGTGATKTWATKTVDQVVRDITGIVNAIFNTTNGREAPDTLLLPITKYMYLATTRMGSVNDTTLLEYILKTNPFLKKIDWLTELSGAGASGGDRMLCYCNDDQHLSLEIPQPFESFDPIQKGMEFEVACHAETAGVIVYYPLSIAFADGI